MERHWSRLQLSLTPCRSSTFSPTTNDLFRAASRRILSLYVPLALPLSSRNSLGKDNVRRQDRLVDSFNLPWLSRNIAVCTNVSIVHDSAYRSGSSYAKRYLPPVRCHSSRRTAYSTCVSCMSCGACIPPLSAPLRPSTWLLGA